MKKPKAKKYKWVEKAPKSEEEINRTIKEYLRKQGNHFYIPNPKVEESMTKEPLTITWSS